MTIEGHIENLKAIASDMPSDKCADWIESLMAGVKALEQEHCDDVSEINDGNIYECSCGYGWNKSKVVRYHFCPNCGKAVNGEKLKLQSCGDCISREKALQIIRAWFDREATPSDLKNEIEQLPSVTAQPKMGHWINAKVGKLFPSNDYKCSECGNILDFDGVNCGRGDANYCPNCGAKMSEIPTGVEGSEE